MEQLSLYLSNRMVMHGIISPEDKVYYDYSIQCLLEKLITAVLTLFSAALFHHLIEVVLFLSVFASIRRNSDGIHCNTAAGCFITSVLVALSTIPVVYLLDDITEFWIGATFFSLIVLCIIATIPHPNLNITMEELRYLKKKSRITVVLLSTAVLIALLIPRVHYYASYMALGVIYNAMSLLIIKLWKGGYRYEEK